MPDGSVRRSAPPMSPPPTPPRLETTHDHALLESLYYSVFETRFINLQPTCKRCSITCGCILTTYSHPAGLFCHLFPTRYLLSCNQIPHASLANCSHLQRSEFETFLDCNIERIKQSPHIPSAEVVLLVEFRLLSILIRGRRGRFRAATNPTYVR